MEYFKKKEAQASLPEGHILANRNITQYFHVESLSSFLEIIQSANNKCYYEFISKDVPVNLFFDIEIYKDKNDAEFREYKLVLETIKNCVIEKYPLYNCKFIVLESHEVDVKMSFHIVVKMVDAESSEYIYFKNVQAVKDYVSSVVKLKQFIDDKIVDMSVYREGLFRTVYSSKEGQQRPLVFSELSDDRENASDLETFVTHCPEPKKLVEGKGKKARSVRKEITPDDVIVNVPQELSEDDKKEIEKFVKDNYGHKPNSIKNISVNSELNCITVALSELYCEFTGKTHKSNHQYIIVDTGSSKQKCHDLDCKDKKYNEIKMQKYPKGVLETVKKCLKINSKQIELIEQCLANVSEYIKMNFDEKVENVIFNEDTLVFNGDVLDRNLVGLIRGTCKDCQAEHEISNTGYCVKCTVCKSMFPALAKIPVSEQITQFFANYTQLVNNGTIQINVNNINGEYDASLEFQLDDKIFNDPATTRLVNESLDGHRINKLAKLLQKVSSDFVYNDTWFTFNGNTWMIDKDNINLLSKVYDLTEIFGKVYKHYTNSKLHDKLQKNLKQLDVKLNKPGFKDEIIREARLYYNEHGFQQKLNSKKHLVPFSNGAFDLITGEFRKTKRDDYVNLTVGFDYDATIHNQEVDEFISKILPNANVRDYVLKKMAECLNGDIPNTNFMMFIGDGANGKSQLLNLMKFTMGDFGEKVEVTLLTRKRNNANEANSEKIKLMNKRFAYLSEPEDNEKINIGLLKELTGSEEIVARELHQTSKTFTMETKLFLACNELPDIKGEDKALWRRIRVVDFPSRFLEEPKEDNEFLIDTTLPTKIREEITWRQTFMNILIKYYSQVVKEPEEVKVKTNAYRVNNDIVEQFISERCQFAKGDKNLKSFSKELWGDFEVWIAEEEIQSKVKHKEFYSRIDKLTGYTRSKKVRIDEKNSTGWIGIQIIADNAQAELDE
jgi:P4 family phage/plasmid primase-like protien